MSDDLEGQEGHDCPLVPNHSHSSSSKHASGARMCTPGPSTPSKKIMCDGTSQCSPVQQPPLTPSSVSPRDRGIVKTVRLNGQDHDLLVMSDDDDDEVQDVIPWSLHPTAHDPPSPLVASSVRYPVIAPPGNWVLCPASALSLPSTPRSGRPSRRTAPRQHLTSPYGPPRGARTVQESSDIFTDTQSQSRSGKGKEKERSRHCDI